VNSETDPRYPDGCLLLLTPNTGTPSPRSCACHSPVGHYQFSKIRRYGYDDITRITNANCGSAAAQTFSFDAFGKNQQGGSPFSFTPTYSAATNRMTSIDGFTPTYHSIACEADKIYAEVQDHGKGVSQERLAEVQSPAVGLARD